MRTRSKPLPRQVGPYVLALALFFSGGALASSMSSHKGPPRVNCAWDQRTYTFGNSCSSDCKGGVCRVQLCLNDGSFMLMGTCSGAKCSAPCS
jgi:hypothetical protein